VAGFFGPFVSPEWFIAEQVAGSSQQAITKNAALVAYQLGNIYLLMAMVGIGVLYATTEPKVVRNYLVALALGDIGHVGITCYVLEYERAIDIANWNPMTYGNIGFTVSLVILCLNHGRIFMNTNNQYRFFFSSVVWHTCPVCLDRITSLRLP
jgi:hypothetical protein